MISSKTDITISDMPLSWRHIRILSVASLGQFIGTALATLIGIVIPMIQLVIHPELSSIEQGILACCSLVGIMVSSPIVGKLSDDYGYLFFFRLSPTIIFIASLIAFFFGDNRIILAVSFFLMGCGIGGDYCLDSDYISELMPKKWKLFMVGVAKSTAALGTIVICFVCFFLLKDWNDPEMWNRLMLLMAIISLIMILVRIPFSESPKWLLLKGEKQKAIKAVHYFLGDNVQLDDDDKVDNVDANRVSWKYMFKGENLKKVIFSGVPWACEGFGVYGIGTFMPILLLSLGIHPESAGKYEQIIWSVERSGYVNIFVLLGFVIGLLLVRKFNHVKTQTMGFVFSALGILIMIIAYNNHLAAWIALGGFMMFELFLNLGPHLLTFILPPQIYEIKDRSTGTGIADAFGKLGAVIGVLAVPILLHYGGTDTVLITTMIITLIGGIVTYYYGRDILPWDKK